MNETQFVGARFYVDRQLNVTKIGGHITQTGWNFFGAIVALNSSSDLPDGYPFSVGDVVASTVFNPGYPSSDYRTPLSVTLSPGYYGLVFGTEALGSTNGYGILPYWGQTSFAHGIMNELFLCSKFHRTQAGEPLPIGFKKGVIAFLLR